MDDRPDIDRFVDQETARLLAEQSWFVAQRTSLRVLVAFCFTTLLVAPGVGFVVFLHSRDEDSTLPGLLVPVAVVLILGYGIALHRALHPEKATRAAVRAVGSYPTSAPGYAQPRERATRGRQPD